MLFCRSAPEPLREVSNTLLNFCYEIDDTSKVYLMNRPTGRRRATTGTASTVTYQATSYPVTTASGFTISNACQRSANPETEAPTGSVSCAG
ncbi:hypothetical protein AMECASPLE_036885 [Ameca splendens]|uniref:Uncharacterized protein n=1 Tax=Ameca splendens TaxID=208324 RepID=A0ABV0Z6M5_9TELE